MNPTFDPIWEWLWPDSLYTLLRPLGEVLTGAVFLVLMLGLLGLVVFLSGPNRQRLAWLGLGVSATVLTLALVPIGLALALLVAGLTIWTYRGVARATPKRVLTIVLLRLGALSVAFLLVLRPTWAVEEDPRAPSVLIVVVDSSSSMANQDAVGGIARWDRALAILNSPRCAGLLKDLRNDKNVQVVFYRAAEDVTAFDPSDRPGSPDGKRTDMGQWLYSLYQRHARDANLRGLVIFSDGADNGMRYQAAELADQWGRIPCSIYTFGLGQKTAGNKQPDLAFDPLSIVADPDPVGVKQQLTVKARLIVNGYQNPPVTLRLFLDNDKDPAAVKEMQLNNPTADNPNAFEVQLTCNAPPRPGEMKVRLHVDKLEGEFSEANNDISTYVTVSKEGLSVLYVEGSLRWEARFIRDALKMRPSLRLYNPYRTRDEPNRADADLFNFKKQHYDVIIIGDITARRFSGDDAKVLQKLKDLVDKEGTGLLMLGGVESTGKDSDWNSFGKVIADILPVQLLGDANELAEDVRVIPTKSGLEHYVCQLDKNYKKNMEIWKKVFLPFRGMIPLGTSRGGPPLAVQDGDNKQNVLVAGLYGKGRTLVFAGDSTWNYWRRTPEAVKAHRRFWQQVVVWLARQENQEDSVWVRPDTRRLPVGGRLGFAVGIRGKNDRKIDNVRFQVKVIGRNNTETPVTTAREPGKDERGTFDKTDAAGEYRVEVVALGKDGKPLTAKPARARFEVFEDDAEDRRQGAEPENLERISHKSDGLYQPASEASFAGFLEQLAKKPLPHAGAQAEVWPDWKRNPPSRALEDQVGTLWASGVLGFFLLFVTLVCLEWFLRRRWGLV